MTGLVYRMECTSDDNQDVDSGGGTACRLFLKFQLKPCCVIPGELSDAKRSGSDRGLDA